MQRVAVYRRAMPRLRPFAALRPPPSLASRVAAPPYDVLDRAEARELCEAEALSFLRVTRADAVLPDSVDAHDPSVYEAAKQALAHLRAEGALVADAEPALYAYEQSAKLLGKQVAQTGLFGCCHADDYTKGAIKRHELTRRAKEDDRVAHALATRAHAGPVFLAHRPEPGLKAVIAEARVHDPLYDVTAPDGVRHRVWRIDAPDAAVEAAARLDAFYIADGHHRAAMAARVAAELPDVPEAAWFPCVLFDADELHVLPYHRVVRDLRGLDAPGVCERLGAIGDVEPLSAAPGPLGATEIAAYVGGTWCRVALHDVPDPEREPVRSLAYVMLAEDRKSVV